MDKKDREDIWKYYREVNTIKEEKEKESGKTVPPFILFDQTPDQWRETAPDADFTLIDAFFGVQKARRQINNAFQAEPGPLPSLSSWPGGEPDLYQRRALEKAVAYPISFLYGEEESAQLSAAKNLIACLRAEDPSPAIAVVANKKGIAKKALREETDNLRATSLLGLQGLCLSEETKRLRRQFDYVILLSVNLARYPRCYLPLLCAKHLVLLGSNEGNSLFASQDESRFESIPRLYRIPYSLELSNSKDETCCGNFLRQCQGIFLGKGLWDDLPPVLWPEWTDKAQAVLQPPDPGIRPLWYEGKYHEKKPTTTDDTPGETSRNLRQINCFLLEEWPRLQKKLAADPHFTACVVIPTAREQAEELAGRLGIDPERMEKREDRFYVLPLSSGKTADSFGAVYILPMADTPNFFPGQEHDNQTVSYYIKPALELYPTAKERILVFSSQTLVTNQRLRLSVWPKEFGFRSGLRSIFDDRPFALTWLDPKLNALAEWKKMDPDQVREYYKLFAPELMVEPILRRLCKAKGYRLHTQVELKRFPEIIALSSAKGKAEQDFVRHGASLDFVITDPDSRILLIIEVDGEYHRLKEKQQRNDGFKDDLLRGLGATVLKDNAVGRPELDPGSGFFFLRLPTDGSTALETSELWEEAPKALQDAFSPIERLMELSRPSLTLPGPGPEEKTESEETRFRTILTGAWEIEDRMRAVYKGDYFTKPQVLAALLRGDLEKAKIIPEFQERVRSLGMVGVLAHYSQEEVEEWLSGEPLCAALKKSL